MRRPLAFGLFAMACAPHPAPDKIAFDLAAINDEGLLVIGSSAVAVHYEFCVPDEFVDAIARIDSTAVDFPSPGRIGCGEGERLMIGSTHQPGWRIVLDELAALPFVARIARTDFE